MRKRIRKLAKGNFEYTRPVLMISEKEISTEVFAGRDFEGSFQLSEQSQMPIRGMAYSSEPRMECITSQFDGKNIVIKYIFHSKGLTAGARVMGRFTIICSQCSLVVPFTVTVVQPYYESTARKIRTLEDFMFLARENYEEAYHLFSNPGFVNLIDAKNTRIRMLYRALTAGRVSEQSMEEFLVSAQHKEKIIISLHADKQVYRDLSEKTMAYVDVKKNTWGHCPIQITAEAPFIQLSRTVITDEMFTGKTCRFLFYLNPEQLHAGKNYGRIVFTMPCQKEEVIICASKAAENTTNEDANEPENIKDRDTLRALRTSVREGKAGLVELYTAYRLKRIGTGVWANESIEILKKLIGAEPGRVLYQLMMAQAYIMNHQLQEAESIMNAFRTMWVDKDTPEWAYYLYLQTLNEREPKAIDRMTREIRMIFRDNPDSVLMFWVLSFLEEEYYANNANKLKAIEYWVNKGCASPYLYLEAYCLLEQDPYLLAHMQTFEIRVLTWAMHHKALNRDIALQIFEACGSVRKWNPFIYKLLNAAYDIIPKPEHVELICRYLIKSHRFEHEFMKWYKKGIDMELRLAGLYEAYLLTMDAKDAENIPKIVQMYFQYESPLPYEKIALLYRSVIRDKEVNPELYDKYRRNICRFAMKQAAKGHMNDDLAYIYNDILCLGLFSEDVAASLSDTVFAQKLTVADDSIVRAIVYQWEMKDPQIVPVYHGTAYVQIFSEDYVVLLEDYSGRRYESTPDYKLEPLIEWEKYLSHCLELAPDKLPYIIASFRARQSYTTYTPEDLKLIHLLLDSNLISVPYKAELWPEYVHYLKKEGLTEDTQEFYSLLDYTRMSAQAREYLMNVIIEDGYYDLAMELMGEYGFDQMKDTNLVTICDHMISEMPDEEDDQLTAMAAWLFRQNYYTDHTLSYLCQFYAGPVGDMLSIYQTALGYPETDTKGIEERILITVLFEDEDPNTVKELFSHYLETGTTEIIMMAYISVCCRNYLLDGKACEDQLFAVIESRYQKALELNDACRLALLKFYSRKSELPSEQFKIADELLREYTVRNVNFAFFRQLDRKLVYKYHLYDKMFLEYRSVPQKHVVLHYNRSENGGDYISEDLPETWCGMYVKQFVMFFGEAINYYITEEEDGRSITRESNRLMPDKAYSGKNDSRYDRINQILMSRVLRDDVRMTDEMKKYVETEAAAASLFKVL